MDHLVLNFIFIPSYVHRVSRGTPSTMFLNLQAVLISLLMWTLEPLGEQSLLKVGASNTQNMLHKPWLWYYIIWCSGAGCFGPMPQNEFLHRMGIRQRIEVNKSSLIPRPIPYVLMLILGMGPSTGCDFMLPINAGTNERGFLVPSRRSGEQLWSPNQPR